MAITKEMIEENKNTFLNLLEPAVTSRVGANWEALKNKFITSDWFSAPASSRYHNDFEGGLVDHSLNVYYNLCELVKSKHLEDKISNDSIAICALLHDMSKMNLYEPSVRNKKVYYPAGSKHDELGNFDWVSERSYATKDDSERFIFGNHEETAEFMIRSYVPLTYEESAAIINHHMGSSWDSCQGGVSIKAATRYPLVALLHIADFLATTIDESVKNE